MSTKPILIGKYLITGDSTLHPSPRKVYNTMTEAIETGEAMLRANKTLEGPGVIIWVPLCHLAFQAPPPPPVLRTFFNMPNVLSPSPEATITPLVALEEEPI